MATGSNPVNSDRELFLPEMTVQAMRDSRYRHPAYAVSELIDNSIDARANHVDLLIEERQEAIKLRHRWKVHALGVFDNGQGMPENTLVQALRFGGKSPQHIQRIGKYGMGLPTSSVSQCQRVDVWTWQHDIEHSLHSYIDVEEIEAGKQKSVPTPDDTAIPALWREMVSGDTLDTRRGTLVVWSKIDRIKPEARTLFNQIEEEVGRIYRHYINDGMLTIRMASIRNGAVDDDRNVLPNDPLYMMSNTSTPEPWKNTPMFLLHDEREFPVTIEGRQESVKVTYSIVKQEALGEQAAAPGSLDHGHHARRNRGVSVVRQDREILLDDSFVREGGGSEDPRNRWWGCEVRFNSGCDNLFEIDHNKQSAMAFSEAAKQLLRSEKLTTDAMLQDLASEDEDIYKIVADVINATRGMMRSIDVMFAHRRNVRSRAGDDSSLANMAASLAKEATRGAIEQGRESLTSTDRQRETLGDEERINDLQDFFRKAGQDEKTAKRQAERIIQDDQWYSFTPSELSGNQMFSVTNKGAVLNVQLNIHHPVYELIKNIEDEAELSGNEIDRKAALAIMTMLLSWGRMEDHIESTEKRREVQDIAIDWGRQSSEVLHLLNEQSL